LDVGNQRLETWDFSQENLNLSEVQFLYQELLDASFMILPSLPMGTPSPPRVVGLKIATKNMAPGRWYFSTAPRSGGLHHHWGLQRPAFVWRWMIYVLNAENIDQIFRSNQPVYSFYLVYDLGVFSREPLPSAKQQWYFQSSDHTFHQVFSSLANMAS